MVGVHIRLPQEVKREIDSLAKAERRSVAATILVLLEKQLALQAAKQAG